MSDATKKMLLDAAAVYAAGGSVEELEPLVIATGTYEDDEDHFEWRLVRSRLGSFLFEYKGYDSMGQEKWEAPRRDGTFGEDYQGSTLALAQYIYGLFRS